MVSRATLRIQIQYSPGPRMSARRFLRITRTRSLSPTNTRRSISFTSLSFTYLVDPKNGGCDAAVPASSLSPKFAAKAVVTNWVKCDAVATLCWLRTCRRPWESTAVLRLISCCRCCESAHQARLTAPPRAVSRARLSLAARTGAVRLRQAVSETAQAEEPLSSPLAILRRGRKRKRGLAGLLVGLTRCHTGVESRIRTRDRQITVCCSTL